MHTYTHIHTHTHTHTHTVRQTDRQTRAAAARLDDAALVVRNLRQGVAKQRCVLQCERTHCADDRPRHNVRGVKTPADAHLEHRNVHALAQKNLFRGEGYSGEWGFVAG